MVAPTLGMELLAPAFLIKLIVVMAIGSLGIAGVGDGATYTRVVVSFSLMSLSNCRLTMISRTIRSGAKVRASCRAEGSSAAVCTT
jgi:L-cystine uptake protein TcyP (sodium:dicarboxylate symporter family)